MATSNMKVSTNDYHCTQGSFNAEGNAHSSKLDLNPKCGHLHSYELKRAESCKPALKPEWLQSKDATKRKRVNRTAKLKQCKLDARREQWLSQGLEPSGQAASRAGGITRANSTGQLPRSHSRAKHVDEDCHDTLSHKENDKRSLGLLENQGSFSHTDRVGSIQPLELGQSVQSAGNSEMGLSTSTVVSMHTGHETQTRPAKWRDINLLQLPGLEYTNTSALDNSFRSTVEEHNNDSATTVHNSFLADGRDSSVLNMHASPVTVKSEPIVMETGLILAGGRICRHEVSGRDGEEMLVVDTEQKQGQRFENLPHSHDLVTAIQPSNTCTSSRYGGYSNDGNGHSHLHDGEDDWEAVADAIDMQGATSKIDDVADLVSDENADLLDRNRKKSATKELQNCALQPDYKYKADTLGGRTIAMGGRAWRPDDAARPPTLPRLSKQHSFPLLSTSPSWSELCDSHLWGPPPAPLFCPICTEELDLTDSSFVPCSCGFRLCLFCHHRIAADDGRCPGCRKTYNSDVAVKLSRASSLWLHI